MNTSRKTRKRKLTLKELEESPEFQEKIKRIISEFRNLVLEEAAQIAERNPQRTSFAIRAAMDPTVQMPPLQTTKPAPAAEVMTN